MMKYSKKIEKNHISNNTSTIKNFPSSTREWNNSIYTFDKNYLNLITDKSKFTIKLIKSYFNLYNKKLEKKIRKLKIRRRFRRLSSNKIFISNGTFKHTSNKVIISIYVYNRQKINYSYLIRRKFKRFLTKKLTNNLLFIRFKINEIIKKEAINKITAADILLNEKNVFNKMFYEELLPFKNKLYKKLIKLLFRRYRKHLFYKQLLFINKSKFNYNYLTYLSNLLNKIYGKEIQFNIINLKNFYSNSDIFTESVLLKIRKNRKNLVRKLKRFINKTKTVRINKFLSYKDLPKNKLISNDTDIWGNLILSNSYKNKRTLKSTILRLIKYKKVTGIRLEAQGRLTKRFTASRSISKVKYKGNLRDLNSSTLRLSSVLLRGNLRSNLQYTKLSSKTRIGSFGLKGWVSGY